MYKKIEKMSTKKSKVPSLVLSWEDGEEQRSSVPETLHRLAIGEYHCHCCRCFW